MDEVVEVEMEMEVEVEAEVEGQMEGQMENGKGKEVSTATLASRAKFQ